MDSNPHISAEQAEFLATAALFEESHNNQPLTDIPAESRNPEKGEATPPTSPPHAFIRDPSELNHLQNAQSTDSAGIDALQAFDPPDDSPNSTGKAARLTHSGGNAPIVCESPGPEPTGLDALPDMVELTDMQAAFVDALLRSPTLDYGKAHAKACQTVQRKPRANVNHAKAGWDMSRTPNVVAELRRRRGYIEAAADAQVAQLENRLARIALGDFRGFYDPETGRELAVHELDDDAAAMIAGLETEDYVKGKGDDAETGIRRKYKLLDPIAAARLLMARRGIAAQSESGGGSGIVANIQINL